MTNDMAIASYQATFLAIMFVWDCSMAKTSVRLSLSDELNDGLCGLRWPMALVSMVLSLALEKYIEGGRALARKHGLISREKAKAYDWAKLAGKYVECYRSIING